MSVTIKQIAEISGVSRGTVDRVLNNRGKVDPEKARLVKEVADKLGYIPNKAGKALAISKKNYVIGIILPSVGNPFFDEVIDGIRKAEKEFRDYKIRIKLIEMKGYDIQQQLQYIDQLKSEISALILTPIDDPLIIAKINELEEANIAVVALNTDIKGSKRMCYVGSDYKKGGKIAAGILGLAMSKPMNIGIIHGSKTIYGHNQRVSGFQTQIHKSKYLNQIVDIAESLDDDDIAYQATLKMLNEHPQINALFIVAAGVYGVCKALEQIDVDHQIKVVCFDEVPKTIEMLKKGIITATISQQPYLQGKKAVNKVFEYLLSGQRSKKDVTYVENQLKIKEFF